MSTNTDSPAPSTLTVISNLTRPQLQGDPFPEYTVLLSLTYQNGGALGTKNEMMFACGCNVTFYSPPANSPNPDYYRLTKRLVCQHHIQTTKVFPFYTTGSNFIYDCPACYYPLELSEDFDCEAPWSEYDTEVHATQFFGGSCDGVGECPICSTPIDYEVVYQEWEEWRADNAIDDDQTD